MAALFPILKDGSRYPRPIVSSVLMVGAGRRWKPVACSRAKTKVRFSQFTLQKSAYLSSQKVELLFERATAQVRPEGIRSAKFTMPRSKPPKQMRLNAP